MSNDLFYRILSDFAERLKELIDENKIDVKTLSKETNIDSSSIYVYLEKKYLPKLYNLLKIADYFQVTMDFLLGLEEQNSASRFLPCPPFSERFPFLLKNFGVTKYYLNKKLKIANSLMYYWQIGKKVPTAEHLVLLSKEFHCSIDFILGREF